VEGECGNERVRTGASGWRGRTARHARMADEQTPRAEQKTRDGNVGQDRERGGRIPSTPTAGAGNKPNLAQVPPR